MSVRVRIIGTCIAFVSSLSLSLSSPLFSLLFSAPFVTAASNDIHCSIEQPRRKIARSKERTTIRPKKRARQREREKHCFLPPRKTSICLGFFQFINFVAVLHHLSTNHIRALSFGGCQRFHFGAESADESSYFMSFLGVKVTR